MSTRCHIRIKQADGTIWPCMIYQHSDGYPDDGSGVMTWLPQIVEKFFKDRGDDAEYAIAQILRHKAIADYIYYEKRLKEAKKKKLDWPRDNLALHYTGYGVCLWSDSHGDIAYMYTVHLKNGTVTYTEA